MFLCPDKFADASIIYGEEIKSVQYSETEARFVGFMLVFLMSSLNRHWTMHRPVTVGCKFFFAVKLSKLCGVFFYDSHLCNLGKKNLTSCRI